MKKTWIEHGFHRFLSNIPASVDIQPSAAGIINFCIETPLKVLDIMISVIKTPLAVFVQYVGQLRSHCYTMHNIVYHQPFL